MRQAGISGMVARKRGRTTIRVPGVRVCEDLVDRGFLATAPNLLRVADITYRRQPARRRGAEWASGRGQVQVVRFPRLHATQAAG